ncbi:hypothetical protein NDU88_007258 [Pleurodeles waltl]|uniref:Uncharacterized protein n=1 Tax=Pleurodeles waltl TaxID=8319 RepID=A0AAV7UND1_PLEWA|nr:hypothetical protein NDU88_007258 [Pleurodeles waltl]
MRAASLLQHRRLPGERSSAGGTDRWSGQTGIPLWVPWTTAGLLWWGRPLCGSAGAVALWGQLSGSVFPVGPVVALSVSAVLRAVVNWCCWKECGVLPGADRQSGRTAAPRFPCACCNLSPVPLKWAGRGVDWRAAWLLGPSRWKLLGPEAWWWGRLAEGPPGVWQLPAVIAFLGLWARWRKLGAADCNGGHS